MSVADKLITVAENELKVYNSGKLATLDASKYMNASVRGTVVAVDDVSPTEHHLSVKLSSKNLIPYPFIIADKAERGITFTDNEDGTITANGTATGQSYMYCLRDYELEAGTYSFSGCTMSGDKWNTFFVACVIGGTVIYSYNTNTFTITEKTKVGLYVCISEGFMVDRLVFKPQIEKGTTVTPWTPYIPNVSGVEVIRYGKNIAPCINNPTTVQGITFTPNADGSVTADGTSTGYAIVTLKNPLNLMPNVNYRLSGSSANCIVYISYYSNGTMQWFRPENYTFTWKDTYTNAQLYLQVSSGKTLDNEIVYPQLEVGNTVTDFEPYTEPQTAHANDGSTVEGLTSLTPSMTLVTDTDGIAINCQYYRDVDKYIDNLVMNVALTGGE